MKQDRKAITNGLSRLLEAYFNKNKIKWVDEVEVNIPWNLPKQLIRVDYMTFSYPTGKSGSIFDAEKGSIEIYEVKSCMADYKSGHGTGWVGDRDYLVCPSTLAEQLRGEVPHGVGVLCPIEDGRTIWDEMKEQIPYTGQIEGWTMRKYFKTDGISRNRQIPLVYALAQMVYAAYAHRGH